MLILICFFITVLIVILLSFLFCHKNKKRTRNDITNEQKIHFKLKIFKNTYAEFDYETNNKKGSTPP